MTLNSRSRREALATAARIGVVAGLGTVLTAVATIGFAGQGAAMPAKAQGKGQLKSRGVVYDVGLRFAPGKPYSVEPFDPALVKFDIHCIAHDLHATAVRIEGEEIERLVTAARIAHSEGLCVFFNPWKMGVSIDDLATYYAEAASSAEQLRKEGIDIVFVTGCETSIFNAGVLPGATLAERIGWLGAQFTTAGPRGRASAAFADKWSVLNTALANFARSIRGEFKGRVTYSAGLWEQVDWSLFDIVGVDHYRQGESAEEYVEGLKRYQTGKPVVVMEVGSCAYVGAAARGGGGFMILEGRNPDGSGKFAGGVVPSRSEREQADYVGEVLELIDSAGADGVFIYVFSFPQSPIGEGARDFDMVSYSLVKTFPKSDPRSRAMPPWVPKEAFFRTADFYRRYAATAVFGR